MEINKEAEFAFNSFSAKSIVPKCVNKGFELFTLETVDRSFCYLGEQFQKNEMQQKTTLSVKNTYSDSHIKMVP